MGRLCPGQLLNHPDSTHVRMLWKARHFDVLLLYDNFRPLSHHRCCKSHANSQQALPPAVGSPRNLRIERRYRALGGCFGVGLKPQLVSQ